LSSNEKGDRPQQRLLAFLHRVDQLLAELEDALTTLEDEPLEEEDLRFIAEEINTLTKGRDNLASEVRADVYRKYKSILMKHKETAVVSVVDNTCTGCHVQIPTSLTTKMRSEDRIYFCPSCGRILVMENA